METNKIYNVDFKEYIKNIMQMKNIMFGWEQTNLIINGH